MRYRRGVCRWTDEERRQWARADAVKRAFGALLDEPACTERTVQRFLLNGEAWFLIGGILQQGFGFGHPMACLFREFLLGTNYVADYLLVGKGSGGHEFVFVELEAFARSRGCFSAEAIRKGIARVQEWRR